MNNLQESILTIFRENELFKDIDVDDDFFDKGVSSLSLLEIQVLVENSIGINLETSNLMALNTIRKWVSAYKEQSE